MQEKGKHKRQKTFPLLHKSEYPISRDIHSSTSMHILDFQNENYAQLDETRCFLVHFRSCNTITGRLKPAPK